MTGKRIATSVATVLGCAVAGAVLVGCDDTSEPDTESKSGKDTSVEDSAEPEMITGVKQITVAGHSVNVSCSGDPVEGRPVVVLMHGGGDDLTTMADFQEVLAAEGRVCSYDRLGAGDSDQPEDMQDYAAVGETLTGVLDAVSGDAPVVLVGHSMGGLLAGRYAPDNPDRVAGLVLLDATSPSAEADLVARIPEDAPGDAGELRAQTLAIYGGENPEKLVFVDGEVESAGDIPVRVIQHGVRYLAEVPNYGAGLEKDWSDGQKAWLGLSTDSELSTADESGHYIHLEAPDLAVEAVLDVTSRASA